MAGLAVKPALGSVKVGDHRLGHRRQPSRSSTSRIDDAQSFVPDSPNARKDSIGHGTFVAGLIAAELNNGTGHRRHRLPGEAPDRQGGALGRDDLAGGGGRAPSAGPSTAAHASINLSLAAFRNPLDPANDQYSPLEEDAIN